MTLLFKGAAQGQSSEGKQHPCDRGHAKVLIFHSSGFSNKILDTERSFFEKVCHSCNMAIGINDHDTGDIFSPEK